MAQAVLAGQTRGYKRHPQLARFLEASAPRRYIATYLQAVHIEALRRGYSFDAGKLGHAGTVEPLAVTTGQLEYEWAHLQNKLTARAPSWFVQVNNVDCPDPHPLFRAVPGEVEAWEVVAAPVKSNV